MPTPEDQPSLLARLRDLSQRIGEIRRRFSLPKGDKDRYETHGAASNLQRLKRERSAAQANLDPIRLIASGISCRDCQWFSESGEVDAPTCHSASWPKECATEYARAPGGPCGPEAIRFLPVAAHA